MMYVVRWGGKGGRFSNTVGGNAARKQHGSAYCVEKGAAVGHTSSACQMEHHGEDYIG
jgi:hypothetical protein